jgi:Type IV secretion system pilin
MTQQTQTHKLEPELSLNKQFMNFIKPLAFAFFLSLFAFSTLANTLPVQANENTSFKNIAQATQNPATTNTPITNPATTTGPTTNPGTTTGPTLPETKQDPEIPPTKQDPEKKPDAPVTTTTDPVVINLNIFNVKCVFPGVKLPDGKTCADEDSVLGRIENLLIGLAPSLAVLVMIWGGYLFYNSSVTSQGGERGIKAIQAAVIGLTIVLLAPTVRRIISIATDRGVNDNNTDGREILSRFAQTIVKDLLVPLANIATFAAAAFAVLSIIVGGYNFILGAFESDAEATKKGTAAIRNAVIGLVVIILSISIVSLLQGFLGSIQIKVS